MAKLSIVELREHRGALDDVTRWIDREWGEFSGRTPDETRARFAQEFTGQGLPTSVVALDGTHPMGVATLRERDSLDWDPTAIPWICNVYVREGARGMGIAGRLCRALERIAKDLGYPVVHLATVVRENSLYYRLGYVRYASFDESDEPMYLMRRRLE